MNNFGGQALERASIVSLGITPYITSSIIVQLLQIVVPSMKEWNEQGEAGKKKASRVTRYITIVVALANALMLVLGSAANVENVVVLGVEPNFFVFVFMALCITAGSCIIMWFADLITKFGVGNGSSLMICAGIVTSIPTLGISLWSKFITNKTSNWDILIFIGMILMYVGIILLVTFMQITNRKIPVQYANRQGKSDSNIPINLNSSSVMPVIIASTLMSVPLTIVGMISGVSTTSGVGFYLNEIFNSSRPIGMILYIVLIVVFSFFYSFMTINPDKIADNLSKSNAFIPGVRPGDDTTNEIAKILFRVTVIGSVLLVIVAIIPVLAGLIFNLSSSLTIGGTSLIIIVGVAIETVKQLESDSTSSEYGGIL
jgi:preprotein translocase subunit SecY